MTMEYPEYSINKADETDGRTNPESTDAKGEDDDTEHSIILPKRRIILEPLLIMYSLSMVPLMQVYQLYVYERMEEIVAQRPGFNQSMMDANQSGTNSSNPCQQEVNKSSQHYKFTQAAQAENAHFAMVSQVLSTVPSLFVIVILGSYSDKGGRKIAIIPHIIGNFISSIIFFLVIYFKLSVWLLQTNNVILGLSGGWELMLLGCYAYLADTTTKEERLFRFAVITILEQTANIIGPIGIGYWISKQGYIWPVVFTIIGYFICVVYVIFFVPETVRKDKNSKFLTLSHLKRSVQVFLISDGNQRRWKLWTLLFVFIVYCIGAGAYTPISLFELNTPLCWDAVTIGYFKTTSTGVVTLGGLCSTRVLKWIASDEAIAIIASVAHTAQYIYLVFIKNTLMMFLSTAFGAVTIALMPTTRALMSQQVTPKEQGSLFGVIAVVESLALMAGVEFFSFVYGKTLFISTSFVFIIAAVIYSFIVVIYIFYTCRLRIAQKKYQRLEHTD